MNNTDSAPKFTRRNEIENARAPEVSQAIKQLQKAINTSWSLPPHFRMEIFTVASLGAGCLFCQAHGAYVLARNDTPTERIQALWDFERSPLFTEAERVALRFALAAGQTPTGVTPQHHVDLRTHYSDRQISDILNVICLAAWLNRWNDSLATVLDQASASWATRNLSHLGWNIGPHTGDPSEERPVGGKKRQSPEMHDSGMATWGKEGATYVLRPGKTR